MPEARPKVIAHVAPSMETYVLERNDKNYVQSELVEVVLSFKDTFKPL